MFKFGYLEIVFEVSGDLCHTHEFLFRHVMYFRSVWMRSRCLFTCWHIWWLDTSVSVSRSKPPRGYRGIPVYFSLWGMTDVLWNWWTHLQCRSSVCREDVISYICRCLDWSACYFLSLLQSHQFLGLLIVFCFPFFLLLFTYFHFSFIFLAP